ncbi:hypothetical protein E1B28_008306 [Marasmius oreades]|nr:uncharacterized protein E1B28_008306 [Marasmius oreades]KAG7091911.1 hypothetical protein E1B28_008306 [Marasmius oreades]
MVSELFEYPFDLAKVRLQSQLLSDGQPTFKGPIDCLVKTWQEEGVRGLYRGLTVPLVGSMAETAAIFLAYNSFQNAIHRYYGTGSTAREPLSITQLGIAAAGAGALGSFIITPIELVKCKLQVQTMSTHTPSRIPPLQTVSPKLLAEIMNGNTPTSPFHHTKTTPGLPRQPRPPFDPHLMDQNLKTKIQFKPVFHSPPPLANAPGPISITRSIIQNHGLRGLWLGHTGTVLRDTGGTAVWFATKEWIGRLLRERRRHTTSPQNPNPLSQTLVPWESALAGAVAGAICTAALYPADTVKSAVQTEEELREYRNRGASAAREWSANHGHHPRHPQALNPITGGTRMDTSASLSKTDSHHLRGSSYTRPSPSPVIRTSLSSLIPKSSFVQTFIKIYSSHGLQGLYSGCGMTMARAIPSSGIVFVVYDGLMAWLG